MKNEEKAKIKPGKNKKNNSRTAKKAEKQKRDEQIRNKKRKELNDLKKNLEDIAKSEQYDYYQLLKWRLREWRLTFEINNNVVLNLEALAEQMSNYAVNTSAKRLATLFDGKKGEVRISEVVALCKIYNIPLSICDLPVPVVQTNIDKTYRKLSDPNGKDERGELGENVVKPTISAYYDGRFYVYSFCSKYDPDHVQQVKEATLVEGTLDIQYDGGKTMLTYTEQKNARGFNGEILANFVLKGELVHLTNPDICYALLLDKQARRAMAVFFKYLNLSNDVRYYMTLSVMKTSDNMNHLPVFQKMAAFRNPQDLEDENFQKIIRGMLNMNTTPCIALSGEYLELLRKTGDRLAKFVNPEKAQRVCYMFEERDLRAKAFAGKPADYRTERLLQLRAEDMLQGLILVEDTEKLTDFVGNLQKEQNEKKSSPDPALGVEKSS